MHHQYLPYAPLALAAMVAASPVPQDGGSGSCPKITSTNFTVGTQAMNWGNASPGDVVSYLFKPGGPCEKDINCLPDPLVMPSTFVNPQEDNTWQPPNPITLSSPKGASLIPDDLRNALMVATSQGFANGATVNAHKYGGKALDAKSGAGHAGTWNENWQANYMEISLMNGDERCAYVTVDASSWSPDTGGACKDATTLSSGISAALSIAFPPFAILAGFFGAVGLACSS